MGVLIVPAVCALVWVVCSYLAGCDPFFFLASRVYLIDCRGHYFPTRERIDRNGIRWSYVYPATRTGHVVLLEGGLAIGMSFIVGWTRESPPMALADNRVETKNAAIMGRLS